MILRAWSCQAPLIARQSWITVSIIVSGAGSVACPRDRSAKHLFDLRVLPDQSVLSAAAALRLAYRQARQGGRHVHQVTLVRARA